MFVELAMRLSPGCQHCHFFGMYLARYPT